MKTLIRKIKQLFEDWNDALRESTPYISHWSGWYGISPIFSY